MQVDEATVRRIARLARIKVTDAEAKALEKELSGILDWVKLHGDPRDPRVDVVDWIELIPYTETRNYVQRLMENLQVYRARLGAPGLTIEADLRRGRAH